MKRKLVTICVLIFAATQFVFAASDLNVMDDIGFSSTFAYYSSAEEDVNMQTGNVILTVPVSALSAGPEGSGLDLQLKI